MEYTSFISKVSITLLEKLQLLGRDPLRHSSAHSDLITSMVVITS
jgi:hypothetical protein